MASATSAAVAVPRNLSGAATTCIRHCVAGPPDHRRLGHDRRMTDAPTSDGSGSNGDRPVVLVSNRGPLSFTVGPGRRVGGSAGRGRAGVRPGPAHGRHRRPVGGRGHVRGRSGGGAVGSHPGRGTSHRPAGPRPRRLPDGLRRGGQRHLVVRAPRPVGAGPPTSLRPPLHRGLGRLPPGQPGLRRAVTDQAPPNCGGAGAGLPPEPARADAGRATTRSGVGALLPHTLRRARLAAGATRCRGRRTARGSGRPPRLRLPCAALGRGVRRRLPPVAGTRAHHLRGPAGP